MICVLANWACLEIDLSVYEVLDIVQGTASQNSRTYKLYVQVLNI